MNLSLKLSLKFLSKRIYFAPLMRFGAKKTTKPTSGSDVEADKSKKVLRGGSNHSDSDSNENTTKTTKFSDQPSTTSSNNASSSSNVKEIQTVPGHKAPFSEETIGGRYAQTLFIAASQKKELFLVFNDMVFITQLYEKSPAFKTVTDNAGLNLSQLTTFSKEISECGDFCKTTMAILDLLAKNKRFMYINDVGKKYIKLYQMLSKEEKITIISAYELNNEEKDRVKEALHANPENEGKSFILDYKVNPAILGGLQMYSENKFMDLSLNSRVERLKEEVSKMI